MDVAHAILFARKLDVSRLAVRYLSAKFELILINLTDKFSAEAQALAEQERVILLNGEDFASVLVRHGLENGVTVLDTGDEV